jgi:predicted Holliday junction resolvase-like endonuclease
MDILTIAFLIIFLVGLVIAYFVGTRNGARLRDSHWEGQVDGIRQDAITRSRAVLGGQFSEQLAPYLPDFKYSPTECKFIGKPVDFIVFKGADNKQIEEVVFVEVKSNKSKLSSHEKNLKETIEKKKVSWESYHVPEDITKKKDSYLS